MPTFESRDGRHVPYERKDGAPLGAEAPTGIGAVTPEPPTSPDDLLTLLGQRRALEGGEIVGKFILRELNRDERFYERVPKEGGLKEAVAIAGVADQIEATQEVREASKQRVAGEVQAIADKRGATEAAILSGARYYPEAVEMIGRLDASLGEHLSGRAPDTAIYERLGDSKHEVVTAKEDLHGLRELSGFPEAVHSEHPDFTFPHPTEKQVPAPNTPPPPTDGSAGKGKISPIPEAAPAPVDIIPVVPMADVRLNSTMRTLSP